MPGTISLVVRASPTNEFPIFALKLNSEKIQTTKDTPISEADAVNKLQWLI